MERSGSPGPASIASCDLICQVVDANTIETFVEAKFVEGEKVWAEDGGSPMMRWYRNVSSRNDIPKATKGESGEYEKAKSGSAPSRRPIAWKTSKEFLPSSLFFKTLDTGRLLPMHLAPFQINIYAHKMVWKNLDERETRMQYCSTVINGLVRASSPLHFTVVETNLLGSRRYTILHCFDPCTIWAAATCL